MTQSISLEKSLDFPATADGFAKSLQVHFPNTNRYYTTYQQHPTQHRICMFKIGLFSTDILQFTVRLANCEPTPSNLRALRQNFVLSLSYKHTHNFSDVCQ